ncbi:UDP-N-acetylmuramoyl-tripeptide--D-alanyl-D-alanine ligase [Helicobacter sp. MIT 99-5507]|uniref:Mur ligase family protein n=1 Tax=Helicobacter sp. MIT 99-5507 TaxID=152489 RepID=UPI000E1EC0C0|nr:UDP-N-acetylmuramoyl-tripeptide--D-alanyl-D-alanine ligase [Helicobacter sp. MIT 99-5507]RDU58293.1 UDP-MurNac-pentapeptide presynthetase MurF [Helicobacter sp. MIT 99-5507]
MNNVILQISNIIFMLSIGYYLLQNLQWYNYNILRVIFKHNKFYWHLIYFILPVILFCLLGDYFIYYNIIHIALLIIWYKKLDKKLVWTSRICRFFITYFIFIVISFVAIIILNITKYILFISLIISLLISYISEMIIIKQYKKMAIEKLHSMENLTIIAITASYGKTSIKNFIYSLLSKQFKTYATPRSVNTINGIISDINNNLPNDCQIYIVEAGARVKGDIEKISNLINHHYAVIGEIGEMHLQYFKSLENIKNTKYELFKSTRLKEVFLFKDNEIPSDISVPIIPFPQNISNIHSDLSGSKFDIKLDDKTYSFETKILGEFNISNLCVAIMIAYKFGVSPNKITQLVKELKQIEHRLEKIEINGKIILDDSFNGNLNGMKEAIRLASLHKGGKKIIVTPGIVENNIKNNEKLAILIDKVLDIAIITGELNSKILAQNISNAQKIIIKDKMDLNNILSKFCSDGDLILFANDAPSYI